MANKTGTIMTDDAGKTRWQPLVSFASRAIRDAWSKQVIDAVHQKYPDALQEMAEPAV